MTEVTQEQIHAMIREHMEYETARAIEFSNSSLSAFQRSPGRVSRVTTKDLIEMQMDDAIELLQAAPSPAAIENLGYLQALRAVAERIEKGEEVMGPLPTKVEKPKATRKRRTKAEIAAAEAATNPAAEAQDLAETATNTLTEKFGLKVNSGSPSVEEPVPAGVGATTDPEPVPELTQVDNNVLDLL